jgi:ABC-type antimicrobial peptide transport system permease subunit
MNFRRLIIRSLVHYWPSQLGVAMAAAVATAVLVGALVVGDSVRASLLHIALARLGDTQLAMTPGDRMFTVALADKINGVPVLALPGVAIVGGGAKRVPQVNVLGVDERFWKLGNTDSPGDKLVINRRLADQLDATVGDRVLLRLAKPSALPRDVPLGADTEQSITLTMPLGAIADDEQFGRFSLQSSQIPPFNAFVPLKLLQDKVEQPGRANMLLIDETDGAAALKNSWTLADIGLEVRTLEAQQAIEMRSDRVFIDDVIAEAAPTGATPVLTYFVNDLAHGDRHTPYSMVTARPDINQGDIVVTDWLAEDLSAQVGDKLTLRYFILGDNGRLDEQSETFRVSKIVPVEAPGGDRELMPDFPGLADVDDALDWEPGIPIDLERIRDKDETYWDEHRGAPKAFVNLDWAQEHWGNRFGKLTALRWPTESHDAEAIAAAFRERFDPAAIGLVFRDVRMPALDASQQGTDFGGLFIGLSFFLIVAALLLTGLMFAFGVEQRTTEIGLLRALGFTPGRIKKLWLIEGGSLAMIGAIVGVPLGIAYTKMVLTALNTQWQDAVAQTTLEYHAGGMTLVIGAASGLIAAVVAMAWALRRQGRAPIRALLNASFGFDSSPARRGHVSLITAIICGASAIGAIGWAISANEMTPDTFFSAGSLLLIAGLCACGWLMRGSSTGDTLTLRQLSWRNSTRRRGRSLATITMLACAVFLIVSINAFRHDPSHVSDAATGGFELFAQTTLPVYPEALRDVEAIDGASVMAIGLRAGDEASCLNLNRPQTPPLLGVVPGRMKSSAFEADWALLQSHDGDAVPALVDAAVAQWILHKTVGDTIDYIDEAGQVFAVKIVGTLPASVLQGYLVINEADLRRRYPSTGGYSVMLIDAPADRVNAVSEDVQRVLADYGVTIMTTTGRMMLFSAVENTYLSIFAMLGGLGLLLGSIGLGLVVMRNVLERRAELAVMRSLGFAQSKLRGLVLREHAGLLGLGLVIGLIAAGVAIAPAPGSRSSLSTIALTLGVVLISGLVWTAAATWAALRGRMIDALRNE